MTEPLRIDAVPAVVVPAVLRVVAKRLDRGDARRTDYDDRHDRAAIARRVLGEDDVLGTESRGELIGHALGDDAAGTRAQRTDRLTDRERERRDREDVEERTGELLRDGR